MISFYCCVGTVDTDCSLPRKKLVRFNTTYTRKIQKNCVLLSRLIYTAHRPQSRTNFANDTSPPARDSG